MVTAVGSAPESATPIEAVAAGLEAASGMLQGHRGWQFARDRQAIIVANAELRELAGERAVP